jgi:hypothetical protein
MPGYTATPEWLGIKVVTVFPANFGTERGSHQGMVLLFEPEHGSPVAIVDGREITAIRTAAATAVATDVLARSNALTLAILGGLEMRASPARSTSWVPSETCWPAKWSAARLIRTAPCSNRWAWSAKIW